jgi:hypothetical protein
MSGVGVLREGQCGVGGHLKRVPLRDVVERLLEGRVDQVGCAIRAGRKEDDGCVVAALVERAAVLVGQRDVGGGDAEVGVRDHALGHPSREVRGVLVGRQRVVVVGARGVRLDIDDDAVQRVVAGVRAVGRVVADAVLGRDRHEAAVVGDHVGRQVARVQRPEGGLHVGRRHEVVGLDGLLRVCGSTHVELHGALLDVHGGRVAATAPEDAEPDEERPGEERKDEVPEAELSVQGSSLHFVDQADRIGVRSSQIAATLSERLSEPHP